MKVKLKSNRGIGGKSKKTGDTVELDSATARFFIATGKAEEVKGKKTENTDG